jgi:hypothetical protein
VSLCVTFVVVLAILVRYAVQFGDRALSLWVG